MRYNVPLYFERKNQIVHISDEGLYTMTDGAVFQGRKTVIESAQTNP